MSSLVERLKRYELSCRDLLKASAAATAALAFSGCTPSSENELTETETGTGMTVESPVKPVATVSAPVKAKGMEPRNAKEEPRKTGLRNFVNS